MNIVLAIAQGLVVMLVAPFFSGLARVIRAKMHNRRGPSILQDYRDLAKLMARPESVSSDSSFVLRIMPPLFLAVPYLQKQSKISFSRAKKRGQKEAIGQ